jgi:hypothetical protein
MKALAAELIQRQRNGIIAGWQLLAASGSYFFICVTPK